MQISISIDDVGGSVEDGELFDAQRFKQIVRILGAEIMNVYEASLTLTREGIPDEPAG